MKKLMLVLLLLPLASCAMLNPATYDNASIEETYHREEPYQGIDPETGLPVVGLAVTERKVKARGPAGTLQQVTGGMEEKYETPDGMKGEFRTNVQGDHDTSGQVEAILGTNQAIADTTLGLAGLAQSALMMDIQLRAQGQESNLFQQVLEIIAGTVAP